MRRWVDRTVSSCSCVQRRVPRPLRYSPGLPVVSSGPRTGTATDDPTSGAPTIGRAGSPRSRLDTNFDGRSDVVEYYDQGALVRRESDRNFDGRIDLIESFDRVTHERVRMIADLDYDGRADLLVLFDHGRAVYSKWAPVTPTRPARDSGLANRPAADLGALDDPFRGDLAVEGLSPGRGPEDCGALAASSGMPVPRVDDVAPPVASSRVSTSDLTLPSSASAGPLFAARSSTSSLVGSFTFDRS